MAFQLLILGSMELCVLSSSYGFLLLTSLQTQRPAFSEMNPLASPGASSGPHVRRKSVLPVDASVLRDLQAHRSLDVDTGVPTTSSRE
jgi:hypothetical protein